MGPADTLGRVRPHRIGDIGFHHYAFQLRSRRDVDALQAFLEENNVPIVDPASEYYDDYYAVFFTDPDGLKLEGMKYGERHTRAKRARASRAAGAKKASRKQKSVRKAPAPRRRPLRAKAAKAARKSRRRG
ncbi:MAG: VOC family protein [Acetobacteraceae bacterium]